MHSLDIILSEYGAVTLEGKLAFINLLYLAGCMQKERFFQSMQDAGFIKCNSKSNIYQFIKKSMVFNAEGFLSCASTLGNEAQKNKTKAWLVAAVKYAFAENLQWMNMQKQELKNIIHEMGGSANEERLNELPAYMLSHFGLLPENEQRDEEGYVSAREVSSESESDESIQENKKADGMSWTGIFFGTLAVGALAGFGFWAYKNADSIEDKFTETFRR